jgi:hypothetical protein
MYATESIAVEQYHVVSLSVQGYYVIRVTDWNSGGNLYKWMIRMSE